MTMRLSLIFLYKWRKNEHNLPSASGSSSPCCSGSSSCISSSSAMILVPSKHWWMKPPGRVRASVRGSRSDRVRRQGWWSEGDRIFSSVCLLMANINICLALIMVGFIASTTCDPRTGLYVIALNAGYSRLYFSSTVYLKNIFRS